MAQEELQRLVLRVDANIKRYETQLRRMERQATDTTRKTEDRFQRMNRNINRAGMRFAGQFTAAIAAVAAPAALARASQATLQYAQDLESASDRIGFGIEQLQEYRFAAEQNGIATRSLDMGLQRFSRRVAEANQGTGELLGTLEQYDIQLRNADGSMRDINDIFRDYADAIAGADNQSEALRLAFKAFDSEGAALVEFLRGGSQALDDFGTQAREAGVVLEEDLIRQGAEAKRVIDELNASIGADFNRAVLENTDGMEAMARLMGDLARFGVQAGAALAIVADEMLNFGNRYADVQRLELPDLQREAERLEGDIIGSGFYPGMTENAPRVTRELDERLQEVRARIERLEALGMGGNTRRDAPGLPSPPGHNDRSNNLLDQAERDQKEANRRVHEQNIDQRNRDMKDAIEAEAERKRELELQIARDAADAYLDALEENRQKFVRVFRDVATNGVRAAFEGDLPEYAARRMQEAFYDRLGTLFERLAERIFEAGRGKGTGSGDFLSTLASGIGAIFGGGRASGGPVSAGMAYRVGEAGPEMFVPRRDGMIVPNQSMTTGGRGGPISIRLVVDEGQMFTARVAEVAGPMAQQATVTAVAASRNDMDRNAARQRLRLR